MMQAHAMRVKEKTNRLYADDDVGAKGDLDADDDVGAKPPRGFARTSSYSRPDLQTSGTYHRMRLDTP